MQHSPSRLVAMVLTVVLGLMGSVATLAASHPSASACSIAPPMIEISPSSDLQPGQIIAVSGWGFVDVGNINPPPEPVDPDVPVDSCWDTQVTPRLGMSISWQDGATRLLAVVDGPEFSVDVAVPSDATPGWAAVDVDGIWFDVWVAEDGDPCLFRDTVSPDCPPCRFDGQPGPELGAPAMPDCPRPCPLASQPWPDCPPPCDYGPANASAACPPPCDVVVEPWPECPPPCPIPAHGISTLPAPCPDPCPVYVGDVPAQPSPEVPSPEVPCPDPCPMHIDGEPMYVEGEAAHEGDAVWCPDPCDGVAHPAMAELWCPGPCDGVPHPADAPVWCPGPCDPLDYPIDGGISCPPCELVGGDAQRCAPVVTEQLTVGCVDCRDELSYRTLRVLQSILRPLFAFL